MWSFATYTLAATLRGALCFAVGVLALVVTAIRRQILWFALFALLLVLLHMVTLLVFRPPANTLGLFSAPLELLGQHAWITLTPALIPGAAFIYTLVAIDGRHTVNEEAPTAFDA
jgi:hypothetical protein